MINNEKIIKGLEHCLTLDSSCEDCPYYSREDIQELDCVRNLRHDALALLKEQDKEIKQLRIWKMVERGEVIRTYENRNAVKWNG